MATSLLFSLLFYQPAKALNDYVDPNGDGSVAWSVTPSGTHYSTLDEATRQPSTPTTSDYISQSASDFDVDFLQMSSISSVSSVSQIDIWIYYNGGSNGLISAALFAADESTQYGSTQDYAKSSSNTWGYVTFSGLSLTQGQLDGLRVRLSSVKSGGGPTATVYIYAMYGHVTYTESSGTLTVDIVDGGGTPIGSPSVSFGGLSTSFSCQTSTGTFGVSSEKIRVSNTTANGNWSLTIAATDGNTSYWDNSTQTYDYNDSGGTTPGCEDSGDTDSIAGQLTIDPSVGTITPEGGCSSSGISKGSSTTFVEGVTDSITLLTASSSQTSCYYDFTGVGLSQKVPAEQPANASAYTINMTLTVTAT